MSVLITGGTGFIGAEVTRQLLQRREERPFVFDISSSTDRLDELAADVELVRGDLGNFSHVLNVVKHSRPATIYHLGGMLSVPSDADPAASFHTNAVGTFHVLEAARLFDVDQVLFSSTLGTYGLDIRSDFISDDTLQRPQLFYGATKVFGEHMGLFYRRKYGLDFRAVRYPSIVGPGVRTPGVAQYTSWAIESAATGQQLTITVDPDTRIPVMYFKDAARAMVELAAAPKSSIKTVNYLVNGAPPMASAGELVELIQRRVPDAELGFEPNPDLQRILDNLLKPIDDGNARSEWGWQAEFDQEAILDDFLGELEAHPARYA